MSFSKRRSYCEEIGHRKVDYERYCNIHFASRHFCQVPVCVHASSSSQIQRALVRNNQTQRFSQKQALRLHQGLVTSTAEQVAPNRPALAGANTSHPPCCQY